MCEEFKIAVVSYNWNSGLIVFKGYLRLFVCAVLNLGSWYRPTISPRHLGLHPDLDLEVGVTHFDCLKNKIPKKERKRTTPTSNYTGTGITSAPSHHKRTSRMCQLPGYLFKFITSLKLNYGSWGPPVRALRHTAWSTLRRGRRRRLSLQIGVKRRILDCVFPNGEVPPPPFDGT